MCEFSKGRKCAFCRNCEEEDMVIITRLLLETVEETGTWSVESR
jgi:hypothetical protein